jgi:hypothetical protein
MKTLLILMGLALFLTACGTDRLEQNLANSETVIGTETTTPTTEVVINNTDTPLPATETPPAAPTPDGRNLQPLLSNANIDLNEVQTLLPPDAIPAILPEQVGGIMVSVTEADEFGLDNSTRVLGVSINGDSRAYPVPYMSAHEIVNDEVGGRLIAATW